MHWGRGRGGRAALTLAALTLPLTNVLAQTPLTPADLAKLAAKVPDQSWYPPGYYDIRIAAEAQVATFPRPKADLLWTYEDGGKGSYDVIDCGAEWVGAPSIYDENGGLVATPDSDEDPDSLRYGNVALDVSRLRSEFERMGFAPALYIEPLNAYERASIDAIFVEEAAVAAENERKARGEPEPEPEPDTTVDPDTGDFVDTWQTDPANLLAKAVEANRAQMAPKLPQVVAEGGCGDGGGGAPVIVKTSPPGGEIWMISAFAFNVCLRKKPNPWDKTACRWNEIESGADSGLSGRYVYQVRWPDGFERRGTREIYQDEEGGATTTVTLKKKGS